MKKRLQGIIIGFIAGAIFTGSICLAKSGTEMIEALYNNIKIYVDGNKIEPTDAAGKTVEPFIYNGTTYLPVRAVGEAIGKTVTWDGATQSVYLGEKPGDIKYLMEVCPPYEVADGKYKSYIRNKNETFLMGGTKYSNGFTIGQENGTCSEGFAIFNLDSQYSTIEIDVGHIDGSRMLDSTITIYKDNKYYKEYTVSCEELPQKISIPVENCLQMKIDMYAGANKVYCGFGNITVK